VLPRIIRILCSLALGTSCCNAALASCINRQDTAVPISTPTASFNVLGDGTLVDPKTGLMWMRCLLGQALSNGQCAGTATLYTWADALNAAHALGFAGHSDWRLPNPKEVESIMEDRCAGPALNAALFPMVDFLTWTSTPVPTLNGTFDEAWVVDEDGGISALTKNQVITVLLVRNTP
jgi:hypothetical protein